MFFRSFLDNAAGKPYSEEPIRLLECSLEFFLDNAAGKPYSEEPVRLSDQQRGGSPPVLSSMELKFMKVCTITLFMVLESVL